MILMFVQENVNGRDVISDLLFLSPRKFFHECRFLSLQMTGSNCCSLKANRT